jgi:hypothetical protein
MWEIEIHVNGEIRKFKSEKEPTWATGVQRIRFRDFETKREHVFSGYPFILLGPEQH